MFSEFYQLVSERVLFFNCCHIYWKTFVLVVTPLVSIMKDEFEELTRLSLRAFAIGLGDEKGEKAFSSLLHFVEGISPVGDQTALGHLEILIGVVHWSSESTSFSNGLLQQLVIIVQKWTIPTTCLEQGGQDNSEKFTPRCKQFPSFSTLAAKTTLSWPEAASCSSKLKPLVLFSLEADSTIFCRIGKYAPIRLALPG